MVSPASPVRRGGVMAARSYPTYPDLAGKVAVVSGGSRGIGAATCRLLAQNGAKVTVNGRDEAAIDSVVQEIQGSGGEAIGVAADVTDFAVVELMQRRVEEELGPVDVLAAFAGGQGYPTPTEKMEAEQWRSVIDSDLTATFLTVRSFLPGMIERGRAGRPRQLLGPILCAHRASEAPDAGGNPATGGG